MYIPNYLPCMRNNSLPYTWKYYNYSRTLLGQTLLNTNHLFAQTNFSDSIFLLTLLCGVLLWSLSTTLLAEISHSFKSWSFYEIWVNRVLLLQLCYSELSVVDDVVWTPDGPECRASVWDVLTVADVMWTPDGPACGASTSDKSVVAEVVWMLDGPAGRDLAYARSCLPKSEKKVIIALSLKNLWTLVCKISWYSIG